MPPNNAAASARPGPVGVELPALGFGAAPLGNLYTSVTDSQAFAAVQRGWDLGVRYFDTAPFYGYGMSEERLGRVLSGLERASFVLSTKVGRHIDDAPLTQPSADGFAVHGRRAIFDYSREGVQRSVESSLTRLKTDHIDILLLHDIGAQTHGARHAQVLRQALEEALPEMARLKAEGVCRAIGIGVNEMAVCLEAMPVFPLDCIMLAGRYTLLEQSAGLAVLDAAVRHRVSVIVAAPYNSGLLSVAHAPGNTYNYGSVDTATRVRAERIYAICAGFGIEVGAAALQFPLAHSAVACVVAGVRSTAEVESGVERMRTVIPPSLWRALRDADLLLPEVPTP